MAQKAVFVVQGEGRGHMLQALALKQVLEKKGFMIVCTLLGESKERNVPQFFKDKIGELVTFNSPNFVKKGNKKGIRPIWSVVFNFFLMPRFFKSLRFLNKTIHYHSPDIIFNFYEPLFGLNMLLGRVKVPVIAVAHQFKFQHPHYKFPERRDFLNKQAIRLLTWICGYGATNKVALSYYPLEKYKNIIPCPPLLREEIKDTKPENKGHILIYLLNPGMLNELVIWHNSNNNYLIHCFVDHGQTQEKYEYHPNLWVHSLNDQKFLELMKSASYIATTAGFETLCESIYLNKPLLVVPTHGHYEQICNANDASENGVAISSSTFDLSLLVESKPLANNSKDIQAWVKKDPGEVFEELMRTDD